MQLHLFALYITADCQLSVQLLLLTFQARNYTSQDNATLLTLSSIFSARLDCLFSVAIAKQRKKEGERSSRDICDGVLDRW